MEDQPSPSALFGRDEELAAVDACVERVATGQGQVVIVEGEAGIGKTRLLDEVLAHSQDRAFGVFRAGCEELESTLPFRVIGRALGASPDCSDARLAAIGNLLMGKADEQSLPLSQSHTDLRFRVLEEIIAFAEHAASLRPTVILLEDVQWADPSSLLTVRNLGRRVAPLRVALLISLRPTPQPSELVGVMDGLLSEGAVHVRLRPLDEGAVMALLTALLGAVPGERLRAQAAGARGNPLFLTELAKALAQSDSLLYSRGEAESRGAPIPTSLRDTILRRLNFLSAETMRVLQVASILGSGFEVSDLSACLGSSTVTLLPSLDEAVRAGIIDGDAERLTFRHDLLQAVIYEGLSPAVRKGLHREAARVLEAAGRPSDEIAMHMSVGVARGDSEGIRWLQRAARSIAARAPSSAAQLLQRGLDLADTSDSVHDQLVTELVPALVWSGRPADAENLAREALGRPLDSETAGHLRWGLASALAVQGRLHEALEHTEAAAEEPGLQGWRRARLLADASQWRFYTGDVEGAEIAGEEAVAAGKLYEDDVALCLGLSALSRVAMERCDFSRAISLGREASSRIGESGVDKKETDWIHPTFDLAGALVVADQLREAKTVLRAGRALREGLGSTWDLPLFTNTLAYAYLYSGEWDDAVAEGRTVLALMDEGGARGSALWALSLLAYVAFHREGVVAAQEVLQAADQVIETAGAGMGSDQVYWVRALVQEALGDAERAWVTIEQAWELKLPFKVVTKPRMGPDAVRMAVSTAHERQATSIVRNLEELARKADVALYSGIALRCRGLLDKDEEKLLQSVAVLRGSNRPVERAFASEDAGAALARTGRPTEATAALSEALEIYEQVGATRDAARCESALRAAGAKRGHRWRRPRDTVGWASLTKSEMQVVDLVAQGLTNREVGARLFISRRTVETHLSHVFRKLDIASRVELAAEVARRGSRIAVTEPRT